MAVATASKDKRGRGKAQRREQRRGEPRRADKQRGEKQRGERPGLVRRVVRTALWIAAVVVALPIALVPVYAVVPPPFSTLELWTRLSGTPVEKQWVPLDQIAPDLAYAVIMSEDGRFCSHSGVDWGAVREVVGSNASRGASTIPMQVAKNLFLWSSRSYVRKALEVPLAYWMDLVWSKRRMIEIYLNIVEWGPGVFGAEAAARHWFNVPAAKLSRRQAALLAAILPNPIERNAAKPGPFTSRYAAIVERRTRQAGAYVQCIREQK